MSQNKRRSDRVIPFVSDEEVVVIRQGDAEPLVAKLMDLSEVGTLLYVLSDKDLNEAAGSPCALNIYHQGKVFEIPATIARKNGRLIAFDFEHPSSDVLRDVQTKLIRMEVEWMRLSRVEGNSP